MKKILIIEDEIELSNFIRLELEYEKYLVLVAFDGREGLAKALDEDIDLILLDLMLPRLNGIEVCRRIRASKNTPIIMLTARDSVLDRISGLDSGADDYISKPFQIEELLARMRAVFRRMESDDHSNHRLFYKDLEMNLEARIVKRENDLIELTKKEFDLLKLLLKNVNRVMTREVLLEGVWGYDSSIETNIVDVFISYLRAKVDRDGQDSYIQTVRGSGYVVRT